jgi:TolB-like protein
LQIKKKTTHIFLTISLLVLTLIGSASAAEPARVLILPFSINADKDLAYLKKGVADMLATRLALQDQVVVIRSTDSSLMAAEIPEPINAATAVALGAKSGSEYVLFGSLTVLGDSVSTDASFFDVHQKQAVLNFSEVGSTQGEIISHINLLAVRIKEEVFGRKTIASRPPPQESSAKQESGSVSRKHPEKLLDKEAGVGFGDSEETSVSTEVNATLWKTRTFKTAIKGFAIGDVDGDKNNETVFVSSNIIYIYRYVNRRFTKVAEIEGNSQDNFIGVDVADINENGTAEIFVTSLSEKNRLRSFVLEWNGKEFKTLAKEQNWYYRVIKVSAGGPPALLGQKGGFKQVFSGGIYELRWDNVGYIPEDKQRLPNWVNIYGFTYGDVLNDGQDSVLAIRKNSTLSILDKDGQEEWTSSDTYGGSNIYLLSPAETRTAKTEGQIVDPTAFGGIYLQQRIFVTDLDQDKKNEVILVKNHDVTRGLFHRLKKYTNGHFEGLVWDNVGLRRMWKTRKFSGYISDFDVSDLDNDGTDELVFAVLAKSGGPLAEAKSYIVSWSLKK